VKHVLLALVALSGCAALDDKIRPPLPPARYLPTEASPFKLSGQVPRSRMDLPPGRILEGRYVVCVGDDGRVRSVEPLAPIEGAGDVEGALRGWSWFLPLYPKQQPCFAQTLTIAIPGAGKVTRGELPGVAGTPAAPITPRLPPWYRALHAGQKLALSYRVCVGDDGRVEQVSPVAGDAAIDDSVAAAITAASWTITAGAELTAPYCFAAPVELALPTMPRVPGSPLPPLPPPTPYPTVPTTEPGVSVVFREQLTSDLGSVAPRLPDRMKIAIARSGGGTVVYGYRQCVRPDGIVDRVEPVYGDPEVDDAIVKAMYHFTYQPMPVGRCRVDAFMFKISR
jgi:hypothetical protein